MSRRSMFGRTWRRIAPAAIALAVVGALSACGSSSSSSVAASSGGGSDKQLTTVSFMNAYLPTGQAAFFSYASRAGIFTKLGINLQVTDGKGSPEVATAVGSGKEDMGAVFSANLMVSIGSGAPIVAVGEQEGVNEFGFIVYNKSGIKTIQDLAGKTVLIASGSAQEALLPGVLKAAGLNPSSVHVKLVAASVAETEFAHGAADAIAEGTPEANQLSLIGEGALKAGTTSTILWSTVGYNMPSDVMIVNKTFLEDHPDVVRNFLIGYYEAYAQSYAHPKETIADYVKDKPPLSSGEAADHFWSWGTYTCSPAMDASKEPVGYPNTQDWNTALAAAKAYMGVPKSLTLSDVLNTQFWTSGPPVSTIKCPFTVPPLSAYQ